MKHIRSIEVDQPLNELLHKRAAEKAFLVDERSAGPTFIRGLIVGLAFSLSFYAALFIGFY